MKHLCKVVIVCLLISTPVFSMVAMAQTTSQDKGSAGTEVIFDKDDLLAAMTDTERQEFLDMRQDLKELQEAGRTLEKGKAPRRAMQAAFAAKKTEFEEEFGYLRGFNGKTVTVYGNPAPTKWEIMNQVINGGSFRGGSFGYGLHPHWTREEESGAIVGSASSPKIEAADRQAGSEVSAEDGVDASKNRPGVDAGVKCVGCSDRLFGF